MSQEARFQNQKRLRDVDFRRSAAARDLAVETFFGVQAQTITFGGIPSEEAFGDLTFTGGGITIGFDGEGIPSAEEFGVFQVNQTVQFEGIPSEEAFGDPHVALSIQFGGIPSEEAFGTFEVLGGATTIAFEGIPSEEAFGDWYIPIQFQGIDSAEEFGNPVVFNGSYGIPSAEAFGTPTFKLSIKLTGIPSEEAFGSLIFRHPIRFIGIPSEEAFGTPQFFIGRSGGASPFPVTQKWTFFLAYSNQIGPGTFEKPSVIAELVSARGVRLDLVLNRPGSLNFATILDDERSAAIVPVTTCIVAVRDGIVRWSGPVWTVDRDVGQGQMQVGAVGWLDLMDHRQIRAAHSRPEETDDIRMAALFALINAQVDTNGDPQPAPIYYGGHIGYTYDRAADTWGRGNPAGNIINTLVEIESGFDLRVDPVTRLLTTHREPILDNTEQHPYYLEGLGTDRPNTLFAYGLGPDNLSTFVERIDASTLANVINAVPDVGPAQQTDDPDSLLQYGTFESDFPMTGTGIGVEILQAGATAEVYFRSQPRRTYEIKPFPWTKGSSVPRIFDDYDIGDVVRFAAKRGWLEIPTNLSEGNAQLARVFGASISIDDNGDEHIDSLQLAAS